MLKKGKDMIGRPKKDEEISAITRRVPSRFVPIIDAFIEMVKANDGLVSFQPGNAPVIETPQEVAPEKPVERFGISVNDFLAKIGKPGISTPAANQARAEDGTIEPTVTIRDLPDEIQRFLKDPSYYDELVRSDRNIVDSAWFRTLYNQLGSATSEKAQNIIFQKMYDRIKEIEDE